MTKILQHGSIFGPHDRYMLVYFPALDMWIVLDAEIIKQGLPAIIRQAGTIDAAVHGLVDDAEASYRERAASLAASDAHNARAAAELADDQRRRAIELGYEDRA